MGWYVFPTLHPEDTMPLLLPVLPPPHHLSTAHARLQLVTRSGQPPHTKAPGDFKQVPGTSRSAPCPPLSQPRSRPGPLPAPAMAPGAPSPSPSPVLAALLFSSVVLSPAQAIVVYTDREVHGAVGSRVTLHCSFWSSEWVSDDISFTWRYQPEGGRDAISIFHYAKGQPYIDEVGTFKERIQWVGDPRWKDGSIVIHNLDYSDNGTFTCDVKNPPDIVGKTSQVTLYVFEKGVRGAAMEKGKLHKLGKDSSKRGRQTPVLYAMLDHSRSTKAASEKKSKGLGESRKDKK
ncbi:myelin protein P0 [Pteropus alecto]|uniref:myelin protein P0 n=1 Tax=Pteropus alecto TaxID=9402 RepID=UPI000D531E33|nr:myelin protein P0 [Pteropus alecto]